MISFTSELDGFELPSPSERKSWLTAVLHSHQVDSAELSYIFLSDEALLQMNKEFLAHDYYTDIITFPLGTDPLEADMFISIDRVKDNALKLKVPFRDELDRVLVHGLLHLLGHNDKSDEQARLMRAQEDHWLSRR